MRGFGAIDVGCEFVVDRAGLAGGPGPAFSLVLADNETLSIDARDAAAVDRFRTRPALCEYVPATARRNTTSEVALLMVANSPSYLSRPARKPTAPRATSPDIGQRNDFVKNRRVPPTHWLISTQALAHPEIKGLYYLDLDAVIRFPWTHNGEPGITGKLLQEHRNGYSAVAFSRGSNANRFHALRWQVHGERFYARDSAKGRAFFADCRVEIKFRRPTRRSPFSG